MHRSEPCTVGITRLQQYTTDSSSQVNLGEYKAFAAAVTETLLDGGAERAPVKVMVGWDSNDYQIDVGTDAGQAEYVMLCFKLNSISCSDADSSP